jgi:F-type H+-transporting ATPase subunit b
MLASLFSLASSGAPVGASLAMAGGAAVAIDFDRTVLFQMALFALLIVVLKPLLFDPVLHVFALREERTEGERARARKLQEKAGELLRKYERELEKVSTAAAKERERLHTETARLEADILREAREATMKISEEGRRRVQQEVSAIRFQLGKESERLAVDIAARVLGREVS